MGAKRATVYLREKTLEVIGQTDPGELSLRIAAILARYESIVRGLMPAFSRGEWLAIMDANNGGTDLWMAEGGYPAAALIWANVHDCDGIGERWGIDQARLVNRLQQLSQPELLAIDEAITRFWQSPDLDTDEALRHAWCRLPEEEE